MSAPFESGAPVWHYDGTTALRREARLIEADDGFTLVEPDRVTGPFAWDRLIPPESDAGSDSYRMTGAPGWRFGFLEPPPAAIAALLPTRARYGRWVDRLGLWRASVAFAAVAAITVVAVLRSPPLVARLIPASVEHRLGEAMVGDLGGRRCETPAGDAALDALVRRLDPPGQPAVQVVAIPIVNAVTLPGGRVAIFSGLLDQARSPDEVAGVVAHELGHVAHRDVTEALIRQLGLSVLLGGLEGHVGGTSNALLSTAYGRRAEGHADTYAMDLLRQAAISPRPIAGFFRRLDGRGGAGERRWAYFASHPVSADRALAFDRSGRPGAVTTPALDDAQWAALKSICTGVSTKFQWRF